MRDLDYNLARFGQRPPEEGWEAGVPRSAGPDGPGTGVAKPKARHTNRLAPRYKVFVHNDPITSFEFVIDTLTSIFSLPHKDAKNVTYEAHNHGIAFVGAYSLEQAEFRCDQAHSLARAQGYPLTFTYEPE